MLVHTLNDIYTALKTVGAVKSKRDFSRRVLGKSDTYYAELLARRDRESIPRWVVETMIFSVTRLRDMRQSPAGELDGIVDQIRVGAAVADAYFRRSSRESAGSSPR